MDRYQVKKLTKMSVKSRGELGNCQEKVREKSGNLVFKIWLFKSVSWSVFSSLLLYGGGRCVWTIGQKFFKVCSSLKLQKAESNRANFWKKFNSIDLISKFNVGMNGERICFFIVSIVRIRDSLSRAHKN